MLARGAIAGCRSGPWLKEWTLDADDRSKDVLRIERRQLAVLRVKAAAWWDGRRRPV
jgi:hypothetical protein